MNLRHVAALALTGWYLMSAPITGRSMNAVASLRQWNLLETFDSQAECEKTRTIRAADPSSLPFFQRVNANDLRRKAADDPAFRKIVLKSLICVSSDDPRFKETK